MLKTILMGATYEREFARVMKSRGYDAQVFGENKNQPDVIVTNPRNGKMIFVEVKASRITQYVAGRNGFQFLLFKAGASKPIDDDLVCLACVIDDRIEWFIMPLSEVGQRHKIAISQDLESYAGKWRKFRNAFHHVDSALN